MIRLFVADALDPAALIDLNPDQARYVTQVMRLGVGKSLLVFNGRDGEFHATLSEVSKRGARLHLDHQVRPQAMGPDIELVIALVKRAPLEMIVEKATELGVSSFRLVTTRRTNADHTNLGRLTAIATEAAEQCERLEVPHIHAPQKLDALLDGWDEARPLIFCDEAGDDPDQEWGGKSGRALPLLEAIAKLSPGTGVSILIGPEGGFDPVERQRLRGLSCVIPVTLGPRILRADTAAISALSLVQAQLGDWRAL